MGRIKRTANRLGGRFLVTAIALSLAAAILIFVFDEAEAECDEPLSASGAVLSETAALQTLEVEDSLLVHLGVSGGFETGLASFEFPSGTSSDGSLPVQPNLFTDIDSKKQRIAPEDLTSFATVVNSKVTVRLCVDAGKIEPGNYEGTVTVVGVVDVDGTIVYNDWTSLLGLPLAVLIALLATAALDDGKHTGYLFVVALGGAAIAWLIWIGDSALTSAPLILEMAGAQFVGASGALVGLKSLVPDNPA